ncbi:hypothetical protein FOZ63_024100, partial [Perkinsus olseni]
ALAKANMYRKPAQIIGAPHSRVLGLDLHIQDSVVCWIRRQDQSLDVDLCGSVTKRDVARWCSRLVGHVPIAGWLRPRVASLLRVVSRKPWDEELDAFLLDLVRYIAEKLEEVGDPARGAWLCPSPLSRYPEGNKLYHWHIHRDASNAAMGAVLAYGPSDGPLT